MASEATPLALQPTFLADVRAILQQARRKAYAASNVLMVEAYWRIGQRIVQEEQGGKERADYGRALIRNLARALGEEFGGGVSVANLWNFRQFYLTFPTDEKLYALRRELTWTHWRLVMRVENPAARDYYIRETAEQGWNTRQLERNIATQTYGRLLSAPASASLAPAPLAPNPAEFIKDPYVLEFLGLPETPSEGERGLEDAITMRLRDFLMELGKGFSFVGSQFRVSTETSHFYVDLVFYNYLLKCFVLIDLKTRKLTHADIGQMDMYVRMFDDLKRAIDDNPTLGIILCADKDETVVRYSVLSESQQLFASNTASSCPAKRNCAKNWSVVTSWNFPIKRSNRDNVHHQPYQCAALRLAHPAARRVCETGASRQGESEGAGVWRVSIQKVGVAPFDGVCSTDILVLAPKSPKWFGFLLGHASSDELIQFTDLASTGTKMPRTNWSDISSFKVALPPKPIAAAFTTKVAPLYTQITANLRQSRTLATLRDTLLPKLLSGELSVAEVTGENPVP
jgi:predicted nuclease of restriction endonuclease-like (RecB) superfamily